MHIIPFSGKKKNRTDEELLNTFLNGQDNEVLGELYSRYLHLVYGVCLKYFRETEKAKDAVIQIYEKIQTDIHKHTVNKFKNWLYVVVKNHCLMELRKNKPGNLIYTSDDEKLAVFMEKEQELHPIDITDQDDLEEALQYCMEKLKVEQQKCIRLFYFENRCYSEIANLLRIEEKSVKSYIQNGKRNLKICLDKQK